MHLYIDRAPRLRHAARPLLVAASLLFLMSRAFAFNICTPIIMSAGPASLPEEQEDPAVAGTNIYVSYTDPSGLVLQVSHDGGLDWSSTVLDPAGILPRLVASGRQVYIAWLSGSESDWSVEFASSSDDGATFSPARHLAPFYDTHPPDGDGEIQLGVSGPLVMIISRADVADMAVEVSNDGGSSFSQVLLPTFGVRPNEEYIAALGNNVAAVWNDVGGDGLTKVLLSLSTDSGRTFSAPSNLTPQRIDAREPLLYVSQTTGALYLIWREREKSLSPTVGVLAKSEDFGATWSTRKLFNIGQDHGRQFSVAAAGNDVFVTYMSRRATGYWWPRLYISHDAAASFGAPLELGNSGLTGWLHSEDHASRMWADADRFSIVFDVEGTLYIRSSDDGGLSLAPKIPLGQGDSALVADNTALWRASDGSVRFARCE
jgi:hypothetical protein